MRVTKVVVCVASLLLLVPAPARAQDEPLAGLVKRLFDTATINVPMGTVDHRPHFIVGENLRRITRELNVALGAQLTSFPLPSSSGGFTFSVNERGEPIPTSTNFGPLFAERAVTIGRRRLDFGFSFQATSFDSFEGVELESGDIRVIRVHNDCCPPNVGIPTEPGNTTPAFERDLLRSALRAEIDSRTTSFYMNYGLTDRVDVSVAVPIVNVSVDATVDAEILRIGSGEAAATHSFTTAGARTASFSESGSATGLGDILLRGKYNFFKADTTAVAAGLDFRLPSGDKDDLLGTGATQTKLLFVASGEYGLFSPHVNIGYTFSSGNTSDEAASFELDPAEFSTIPGFAPGNVDLAVPDEFNYVAGLSVAAGPYVTLGFDVHGRTLRDVNRFSRQPQDYDNSPHTEANEFSVESSRGNLNLLLGVIGGKVILGDTFLLNFTLLVPMSDDGLKPDPTPVIGFDYLF